MPQYTTGELAKLCGVTVRTVQFYDAKDLLKPSELTEGGRRLYSEDDAGRLRLICMLKALGLTLGSIQGILGSDSPGKVLVLLLEEQTKRLGGEIKDRQKQLETIRAIQESIRSTGRLPVNSISDVEHMMNSKKKLRKTHAAMLTMGIIMDVIQIAALILWIAKGIWQPFAVGIHSIVDYVCCAATVSVSRDRRRGYFRFCAFGVSHLLRLTLCNSKMERERCVAHTVSVCPEICWFLFLHDACGLDFESSIRCRQLSRKNPRLGVRCACPVHRL